MRVGTPGFSGARLTEAREARGMTQTALAELAQLKIQSISAYEQGRQSPSPEALAEIANKLSVPERYFLRPPAAHSTDRIKMRSLSSATKTARVRGERRLGWLKEIVYYVRSYVDFPPVNIPSFNVPDDPMELKATDIEAIADECRQFWNLGFGPIKDLVLLLENSGVIVSRTLIGAETLDAFSQWDNDAPFIVLGADKGSACRSRFDAAHELGHLVLHRNLQDRQIKNPSLHKNIENQAHRFAGAFLLPERSFSQEVWSPTLDAFVSLKKHWKCAVAMMIMRCEQLGILSEEQVKRSWINMSRKGWRETEPLDSLWEPERPTLLRNSISLLIDDGGKTREDIVSDLRMNPFDIEELAGLTRGYMSGVTIMQAPQIRLRQNDKAKADRPSVLNFPRE